MEMYTKVETLFGREVLAHDNLRLVTLASASMVIRECKAWNDHKVSRYPPTGTVLGDLNDTLNWAEHGFVNTLQSHVEIIYAFVEHIVNNPNSNFLDYSEAALLTKALSTYQIWKDDKIEKEKKYNGEMDGDLTEFGKAVWNNHNKELLAAYKR